MCGIAGFFNYKTRSPTSQPVLEKLLQSISYRGPDHLGIFVDSDFAMGNVRLSILDITDHGNQPIYNEDRSIVVVYNGEIYNAPELGKSLEKKGHLFSSRTDTEILVHAYEEYGIDCASDLNGMFAFALFDIPKRILLLGRDRTAQKPLYVHHNTDGVFFCSELKAMIPFLPRRSLNPNAVNTFLCMGYALEPETILNEISALESATITAYSYAGESKKRFWQIKFDQSHEISDLPAWKEEADQTLRKTIRRHLLSDVPITVLLSGGIDSSLLAVYLKEAHQIKKAFTGSFIDSKDHNEYGYASQLGSYCGFEVEEVDLSNKILARHIEEFLARASLPQGDTSGIATYSLAKEVAKQFRVVIGGDGGDELFGGYPTYTFPYISNICSFLPASAIAFAHRISTLLCDKHSYLALPFQLQQLSLAWGKNPGIAHFLLKNFLPDDLALKLLHQSFFKGVSFKNNAKSVFENMYLSSPFAEPVHTLCWIDFNTFLRSGTIPKVERNTMLWSLEARFPYLDNEMIDLSMRTPSSLMVYKTETKRCLKSLLQDKIGGKIKLNPRKQGFSPPMVMLFENELRPWAEHWLHHTTPYLEHDTFDILSQWEKSGWDLHRLKWNICALNDWCFRNKLL